ncbi:MAG: acyl-CoA dehydrogenase family protein [Xanthobacteraceae bacterium]
MRAREMPSLLAAARRIAAEVTRPAAASVDRDARFPREAFAALREERLLAAVLPLQLGGCGCSLTDISAICSVLGRACSSTAAIFAMQQVQLACIARYFAGARFFDAYLREAAEQQWLIASGASEIGVGGDVRTSIAAIERKGDRFSLRKKCSILSYAEEADAILITSRRAAEAPAGDQIMTLLRKGDYRLERLSTWDALGMRGTCSLGFDVMAEASTEQILPEGFRAIAMQTFIPYSCITWSAGWLGIAEEAVAIARSLVRREAGKRAGVAPLGAPRLAHAVHELELMRASVHAAAAEHDRLQSDSASASTLASAAYALRVNGLKLTSAQLVVRICLTSLEACGVPGYLNDSPFSLGRLIRDALAAPLMIGNDRLLATNAHLLLVGKDDVR